MNSYFSNNAIDTVTKETNLKCHQNFKRATEGPLFQAARVAENSFVLPSEEMFKALISSNWNKFNSFF